MSLRKAFEDILPKEVAYRKKLAFPANEDLTSHKLIAQEFKRAISRSQEKVWGILNKDRFEKLFSYCSKEYLEYCKEHNIKPHPEVAEFIQN